MDKAADHIFTGESPGSRWYRITLGDTNNDGYDDAIIDEYAYSNFQGHVWSYYGGSSTCSTDLNPTGAPPTPPLASTHSK
jgi:hypothetical protein